MRLKFLIFGTLLLIGIGFYIGSKSIDDAQNKTVLKIAVASNFLPTIERLKKDFESRYPNYELKLSAAATGQLFAQIINGAPFDVFLSADRKRPELLAKEGLADKEALIIYAIGRLAVMSNNVITDIKTNILQGDSSKIIIPNPDIAPYGLAAKYYLEQSGLWDDVQSRIVLGNNVSQSLQFIQTGNADIGFTSVSLVMHHDGIYYQDVSAQLPSNFLEQAGVILNTSKQQDEANVFLTYLKSNASQKIIKTSGYDIPMIQ